MVQDNSSIKTDTVEKSEPIFKLLFNPTLLLIGVCGGLMVGALEGFADLWAIQFFKQVYKMSDMESNIVTSCVYIGMCVGGLILAMTANLIKSFNKVIVTTGLLTILIFVILLSSSSLGFYSTGLLMFLLGFCCYQVLVFSVVSNIVESRSSGLAIAIVNCINMSFGHFFHKMISNAISYNWNGLSNESGLAIYSRYDFNIAISTIPICCFIGIIGFMYLSYRNNILNKLYKHLKLNYLPTMLPFIVFKNTSEINLFSF